jgi:hypothetical protein
MSEAKRFQSPHYANDTLCACGRAIVVRLPSGQGRRNRYARPRDRDHDLCMRCYQAEMDAQAARRLGDTSLANYMTVT